MENTTDRDLLAKIEIVARGPDADLLRGFVDILYRRQEMDDEPLTAEDWSAVWEGQEDARQGRTISLEEYEKARGL